MKPDPPHTCNGEGRLVLWFKGKQVEAGDCPGCRKCNPCPSCDGTGEAFHGQTAFPGCIFCGGSGQKARTYTVDDLREGRGPK